MEAEQTVREVVAEQGTEATVDLVEVHTDEEARRKRFPGSPTIRVDGRDLFPLPDRDVWALGCRTYTTPKARRATRPRR